MQSKLATIGTLFIALLAGCGGGSDTDTVAAAVCRPTMANPDLCSGSTGVGTTNVALFTTAPSAVTLASGGAASYTIGGGTPAYTATSSNTAVVTTSVAGNAVTLNSISQGVAPIVVVDALGKAVTINVTVLAKGQVGIPPSIFPASITVGDCTTNIPFVFTGGTAPFTIFTSENFKALVSTALPLESDSYFMTSIDLKGVGYPLPNLLPPYVFTVTVLDSQSRAAKANIIVDNFKTPACPSNPLLQVVSASQNAHVTEILAFQITGGVGPYTYTFTDITTNFSPSLTSRIAAVVSDTATSVNVQASMAGTTLLTVNSTDGQKASIRFTALSPP